MTTIPGRFDGKTAIVTGAGSGIGKATATRLAAEGATVVATDVSAERLAELAAEVPGIITVVGDVAKEESIAEVMQAAGGAVHLLANVAGIMDAFLPTAEIDDATWERVLSVNLTGPMRLARAVLPGMIEAGSGAIVNVASEAGFRSGASGTTYSVSKHGVIGLTKSTAFFYGPKGVRCNAVAPGAVATNIEAPFHSQWAGERLGPIMATTVPAPATADELAAAITWLLSDDSANVNGAILNSDGGWSTI